MKFEVKCNPHGVIGTVGQAALGLSLFEAHRQIQKTPCIDVNIKPIEESWLQRKLMRRVTLNGKQLWKKSRR